MSISLEMWETIEKVCDGNISVSSFIKTAVKNKAYEKRTDKPLWLKAQEFGSLEVVSTI